MGHRQPGQVAQPLGKGKERITLAGGFALFFVSRRPMCEDAYGRLAIQKVLPEKGTDTSR